jgi:hypothetical protein
VGDVDEFRFTLAVGGGGTLSSSSSIIIGELRDPMPLAFMADEIERRN